MRCGNVHGCPICCAKIMRLRAAQISDPFSVVHADHGTAVMVTYTAAHSSNDRLSVVLDAVKGGNGGHGTEQGIPCSGV
jgi:hypothetical protein